MLVRNLKCEHCGNNKINELTTGYIYCDFCSALMGFDAEKVHIEDDDGFSSENNQQKTERYYSAIQKMAQALNDHNSDEFILAQHEIKLLEFNLFPKRFSPKAKLISYRKKYLKYFEAYWVEQLEEDYFNKCKEFQIKINALSQELNSDVEEGVMKTEYNDAFKSYLIELSNYIKIVIEKTLKQDSISLFPEDHLPNFDTLYFENITTNLTMFNKETAQNAIKFLNLEYQYIPIDDVKIEKQECLVCNANLAVPENSQLMLCESCGNINDFEKKKIRCIACNSEISVEEDDSCQSCGAEYLIENEAGSEKFPSDESSMNVGQFFKKLFS